MLRDYLSHLAPFVQGVLPDLVDAGRAKVFNLCLIGVANGAEVFEVDVDDEVFGDDFVFIFANVFGTQLHLAGLDVVASLDEGRVEHDAEDDFVGKASVFEQDFDITLESDALLLLFAQQENHTGLLLAVLLVGRVRKLLADVETFAAVDLKKGNATTARHIWHLHELYSS